MATLPTGTVTFVFSDIEGSTALLKRLGDRYGELLNEHRRIVRETYAEHSDVEIDVQGDSFFSAFARARDAVAATVEVQRRHASAQWPDDETVALRMGLHTGEPAIGDEGYLGLDVVRAARLGTAARGGQVLLSETTRSLLGSSLPEGVSAHPLGERRLKDIDEPERVYELTIEGIAQPVADTPAPAVSDDDGGELQAQVDDLARRMSKQITERVLRSLERTVGDPGQKG